LLECFDSDPVATPRQQLRELSHLPHLDPCHLWEVFALVVFLCDDLLKVRDKATAAAAAAAGGVLTTKKKKKKPLPVLSRWALGFPWSCRWGACATRVFGSGKDSVLTKTL